MLFVRAVIHFRSQSYDCMVCSQKQQTVTSPSVILLYGVGLKLTLFSSDSDTMKIIYHN